MGNSHEPRRRYSLSMFFFFNDTATTEIYTLSLHDALPISSGPETLWPVVCGVAVAAAIGLVPTANHAVPLAFWMLVVGAGTAAMTLYFQITISEASSPAERGSALALGGLGW